MPEPQRIVENGTSYVMWTAEGSEGPEQKSLVLRRNSEPLGGTGEPVSVEFEGAPGYFYDSPGQQAAVLWKTESETCDLIRSRCRFQVQTEPRFARNSST